MENTVIENIEKIEVNESFAKLLEKANEIQNNCNDYVVNAKDIRMDNELNILFDNNKLPMSDFASSGLCGKLKVPTVYFNRCAQHNKNLAAQNINEWLYDDQRQFLVREYNGHVRGLLSGSYARFDAPDILKALSESMNMNHYKIKGSFINEERLHVRLVETEMLPIEGEDLFAGITLDSSDIGRSGLYVRFFIYKQICTNGLIIPKTSGELFRQKHVGINSDDFKTSLIEGLESYEEIKSNVVEMIRASKEIPTETDIEELTEQIKTQTRLTDDVVDEVIMLMDTTYDHSKWGLINGITEVAQKYTLERRLQLEQIAGEMLVR